jgi:hypothetical protein
VTELKGKSSEVKASGDRLIAERGVRDGHITYMPAPGHINMATMMIVATITLVAAAKNRKGESRGA